MLSFKQSVMIQKIAKSLSQGAFKLRRALGPQIERKDLPAFIAHLESSGVRIDRDRVKAERLTASETDIKASQIEKMLDKFSLDDLDFPFVVSKDNVIIDGHKRLIAMLVLDSNVVVDVVRINLKADELIKTSNQFLIDRRSKNRNNLMGFEGSAPELRSGNLTARYNFLGGGVKFEEVMEELMIEADKKKFDNDGNYIDTTFRTASVEGNTDSDKALEMWNDMSPVQRLEIMDKVKDFKSMAKKQRAAINYIADFMIQGDKKTTQEGLNENLTPQERDMVDELRMLVGIAEKAGLKNWSKAAFETHSKLNVNKTLGIKDYDLLSQAANLIANIKDQLWNTPGTSLSKPEKK